MTVIAILLSVASIVMFMVGGFGVSENEQEAASVAFVIGIVFHCASVFVWTNL